MTLSLSQKIQAVYPQLQTINDWQGIRLQNDGARDYIAAWDHPALTRPTNEQLEAVDEAAYLAEIQRKEICANRASAYTAEADPLFFKAQRGEATIEEWQAKVAEIRSRYPYPDQEVI